MPSLIEAFVFFRLKSLCRWQKDRAESDDRRNRRLTKRRWLECLETSPSVIVQAQEFARERLDSTIPPCRHDDGERTDCGRSSF